MPYNKNMSLFMILIAVLLVITIGCAKPAPAPAPTTPAPAATTPKPAPAPTSAAATTTAPAPKQAPAPTTTPAPAPVATPLQIPKFVPQVSSAPAPGPGTPKYGGVLKVGVPSDAVAIGQPQLGKLNWDSILAAPALEKLINNDSEGNIVPWLAESWKEDYKTLTLTINLRKGAGIKFHDGTNFNAAAVKWNLDMLMANKVSSVANVKSVDIIDDYTIRVNCSSWIPDIASNVMGAFMVSPTAWQANNTDWGKQNPVGTGPFKLASRQRDANMKYARFDDYWMKGKPYLAGLDFIIIADSTTRIASFKAGEIDMSLDPSVAQCQELRTNTKYQVHNLPGGLHSYALGPSANDPKSPFSNLKVRQALGYAIDRQALVESVLGGYGSIATQQCPPGTWPYNPNLKGYAYDTAKAKQLLAEAGYPNGFETSITASSTESSEVLVCTALQGMMSKVGIKLNLNLLGAAALESSRRGGWDGLCLATMAPSPSSITFTFVSTTGSVRYFWVSFLKSPQLDTAVKEALASPDMKTYQTGTWKLMDMIYYQLVQLVPIYYGDALLIKYPYVKDDGFYRTGSQKNIGAENVWLNR